MQKLLPPGPKQLMIAGECDPYGPSPLAGMLSAYIAAVNEEVFNSRLALLRATLMRGLSQ